jgi:hypothetical protein
MITRINQRPAVLPLLLLAASLTALISGCAEPDKKAGKPAAQDGGAKELAAKLNELDSATYILTLDDLDKFKAGRSKAEILKEIKWRAGSVLAAHCDGKDVFEIDYGVVVDTTVLDRQWSGHALFIDGKFEKFIRWLPGTEPEAGNGTPANQPKGRTAGDECDWLSRAIKSKAVSVADINKEVASIRKPPSEVDPGLTAAYLLLRAAGVVPGPDEPATEQEYLRNAALRDQYNAARLDLGMTAAEIEDILKAKPLEEGKVEAGTYQIYGSNESFNINGLLHFLNIFVVYKEGKAIAITSISAGDDWRRELGEAIIDLPSPPDSNE